MRYSLATSVATITVMVLTLNGKAQGVDNSLKRARNSINAYLGLYVDININYERNIRQRSKSHSNVRLGFGHGSFLTAGEGGYINPAFVHLFGSKNSHIEVNIGIKYMLTNTIPDADFSDTVVPDIFMGYRYEKPSGGFIFRAGLNYPTLINLGIGYKF
jgi:hypothetical protein